PDALPSWPPAHDAPQPLPRPCGPGRLAAAPWRREPRGGTQARQTGQRPDAGSPGAGPQEPTRAPAPAPGCAPRGVGGPDGSPGGPGGGPLSAPSPRHSLPEATDDAPRRDAPRPAALEQQLTRGERRPDGTRQDAMRGRNMRGGPPSQAPKQR